MKDEKKTIKEASKELSINYHSAKTIMRTYKTKGRIQKKITRDRQRRSQVEVIPKALFSIQKVSTDLSAVPSATPSEKTQLNSAYKFSFKSYQQSISDEYDQHFNEKLIDLKEYLGRTLPKP